MASGSEMHSKVGVYLLYLTQPVAVACIILLVFFAVSYTASVCSLHSTVGVGVSMVYLLWPVAVTYPLLWVYLCCIIHSQWWWPAFYCRCILTDLYTTRDCGLHSTFDVYMLNHSWPVVVAWTLLLVYLCCIIHCRWRLPAFYCWCIFSVVYTASRCVLYSTVGCWFIYAV